MLRFFFPHINSRVLLQLDHCIRGAPVYVSSTYQPPHPFFKFGRNTDVPSHLHYIMLELIKNSMRATVDFHGLDEMDNNPIRVVIADGEENEVRKPQAIYRNV